MALILSVLEQGMIYGILALGVYITYKILDFPDSWEEFYVMLNHPFKASSIQVRIDDVHKGTSWDDTCITDIRVLVE